MRRDGRLKSKVLQEDQISKEKLGSLLESMVVYYFLFSLQYHTLYHVFTPFRY